MGRSTQFVGLHPEAEKFLEDARLICEFVGATGMFNEPLTFGLWQKEVYGTTMTFVEILQDNSFWASGPFIFTCLVCTATGDKRFVWTDQEMDQYVYG